jgi:HSP20 family protein
MALIRWEPAAELNTIQTEMNRLFNSLFDNPTRPSTAARRWVPAMDLVETGDHYVLLADLPGLSENDVNVELDSNVLTISGERKAENGQERGGYRRVERSYGSFSRSLTLPKGIDPEAVQASFEHGVLEVRIPKPELVKPRKVTIAVGAGTETRDEVVEGTDSTPETSTSDAAA